ncbi:site-specific integrase [Tenuibacillus multivorans]|uniref:Site-specific recombinase XerD n=1 Tax=Tenuibacillus multivorans TaxID=237069 RepID=A0A1G9YK18_9BACI|nr:site-specific integrase [Tenuibacillus multivorans]GEL78677.1 site-specific integrase [Tenuibacillus multivorans]SDN09322.1 Site-specific recombinase XerD [Tenuibacillus multivorans]
MFSGSIGKDEKTSTWYFVIELGKGIDGKRKQKRKRGYKTKKEAQKALTEMLHQLNTGTYIEPKNIPLNEYLNEWLKNKQLTLRDSTFKKYSWLMNKHIIPHIGEIQLPNLTPSHVQQLYHKLSYEKGLSNENVRAAHKVLSQALRQAVKFEYIPKNVTEFIELPKVQKKEVEVWDLDEVKQFLEVTKDNRYHIDYLIALNTGMRQGEILGLRWKDIDFGRSILNVRQTLDHYGKLHNSTKTASSARQIALPPQLIKELNKHKTVQTEEKLKAGNIYENHDLVVCTSVGTPLHPRNLLRNFKSQVKKAGLKKIRFHDLRHTHASLLLKQGAHPKVVSERLGHADTRITLDTYSHLLPNMQEETAEQFGAMLFGSDSCNKDTIREIKLSYSIRNLMNAI